MSKSPLLYESHAHTPLCKHASGTPSDYAAMAEARGLKRLAAQLDDRSGLGE